jgi:membrane protein required for colicin V production
MELFEHSNWLDYGILALISVSVLMGIIRGFVREAMSLVTWVVALTVGILYCQPVAALFTSISMEGVRLLLAFVLLALTTLIIGGIVSYFLARLINFTGFNITDKIIGILFGLARGVVVISLMVMLGEATPVKNDVLWKESKLVPRFLPMSEWMKDKLPSDLLKKFQI